MDKDRKLKNPLLEEMRQEGMKVGQALKAKTNEHQFKNLCKEYIDAVSSPAGDKRDKIVKALLKIAEVTGEQIKLIYYVLDNDNYFEATIAFGAALYDN